MPFALGKPTVQISTFDTDVTGSHLAVDGIYYDNSNEAVTEYEKQPYWMVDLEQTCLVWSVKLFNNLEGNNSREE